MSPTPERIAWSELWSECVRRAALEECTPELQDFAVNGVMPIERRRELLALLDALAAAEQRAEKAEAERDEAHEKSRIDEEQCDRMTEEAAKLAGELAITIRQRDQSDAALLLAWYICEALDNDASVDAPAHIWTAKRLADVEISPVVAAARARQAGKTADAKEGV